MQITHADSQTAANAQNLHFERPADSGTQMRNVNILILTKRTENHETHLGVHLHGQGNLRTYAESGAIRRDMWVEALWAIAR